MLNPTTLFAALPEDIVPMMAMICVFGIPIIAILTHHQRKMAELVRGRHGQQVGDATVQRQLEVMQAQINDLRGMIQEHIIKNDQTVRLSQSPPPTPTSIEQRLNG